MRIVKWERLPGQRSRAGHTATLIGRKIYVFGGRNGEIFCNDLWLFDMDSENWSQLQEHSPIPPRAYHSATLVGNNRLWIIGGSDSREMHGDVHVLNTDTLEWSTPVLKTKLLPRGTHSAVLHPVKSNCILVYGGYGGATSKKSNWLGDLLLLDTGRLTFCCLFLVNSFHRRNHADSLEFQSVKAGGSLPSARGYHTFTAFEQNVLLYGGKNETGMIQDCIASVYNAVENKWFTPEFVGERPGPRSNHAAVLMRKSDVVLHGGRSGQSRLNDIFLLESSESMFIWRKYGSCVAESKSKNVKMIETSDGPEGRAAHCAVADESSLYIIGGYGGEGRTLSDMYVARRFPFRRKNTTLKTQNVEFVSLPLEETKDNEGWLSSKRSRQAHASTSHGGKGSKDVDPYQWTPDRTAEKTMQYCGDLSVKKSGSKRKAHVVAHEELAKELEALREQKVTLQRQVTSAKAANVKILIEFEAVRGEKDQLKKEMDLLQKQVDMEHDKTNLLQRQIDDRVVATQKCDLILAQVREELESTTFALDLKEREKQETVQQLKSAKQAISDRDSSLERIKGMLEDAILERDEYKSCVQKLELEIQKQMQTLHQTKSNYDAERSFLLQEIAERKGTADRIFTELGISKESCRAMQEHVQQLTRQVEKANEKADQQQKEKDELNRSNGELTAGLRQVTAAKDGAESSLRLLKNELASARTLIDRNELELAKMKESADEGAKHIATLHSSLKKAQEETQLKVADNERLRSHIQELEGFEQAQVRLLQGHIEKLQCARQSCPGELGSRPGGR